MENFKEVKIGDQIWSANNLDVMKFRNGDNILFVSSDEAWRQAGKDEVPACCYYVDKEVNGKKFGLLYNWYAVNDPRGLAPVGWKVPSDHDWNRLRDFLGEKGDKYGDGVGWKLKTIKGWKKGMSFNPKIGTDDFGFSAKPSGYRNSSKGDCGAINQFTWFWSSDIVIFSDGSEGASSRTLSFDNGLFSIQEDNKKKGYSVRCIKE